MNAETLLFKVNSDITIVGKSYGNPQQPPILLLHGGGQTRHSWGDTAQQLAQHGWRAIALDARGHGDSSWDINGNYHAEDLVADLHEIVAKIGKKPALVGASMGGITSLLAEGESKESIASAIVLVDIAPKSEQKGIERVFSFMSANLKEGFASLEDASTAVGAYLPHRPKPTDLGRLERNLRQRNGRWYWHWDPKIIDCWRKITPDLRTKGEERMLLAAQQLRVPTLIVRGGMSDVVSEKIMIEFLDAVPHVRGINVSEAGHMVAGDSNHAFTNAVISFLNEVYPTCV